MSSSRSLRPWPRFSTIPHEDRRRPSAGEEESETKFMAKFWTTLPPQSVFFSLYDEEPGDWRLASLAEQPGPQERFPQRTVEPMLETFVPVPSLDVFVLQMVDQPVDILQILDVPLPEQVIDVLKISLDSAPQRTMLPEPQLAEQLVEVLVPVPSFDDWVRWEETYRATGFTWLDGFDWCLTASPGAVYKYWARTSSTSLVPHSLSSSSSTEWWSSLVAAVPKV